MNEKQILFSNSAILNNLREFNSRLGQTFEEEDCTFSVPNGQIKLHPSWMAENINDFDISIITIGSYSFDGNPKHPESMNCIRRRQEIITSLDAGKTIILLVEKVDALLILLMNQYEIKYKPIQNHIDILNTNIPKFRDFVKRYCAATVSYSSEQIQPICNFKEECCGFYIPIGIGKLYVLPVVMNDYRRNFFLPLLQQLLENVGSIDAKFTLPKYLTDHELLDEKHLIDERKKSVQNIMEMDKTLNKYNTIKSILALKHDLLADNIVVTLNDAGIATFKLENYEEDLWILENGKKEIICEVKGTKSNFTRKQLNDLDNHRDENKLSGNFPALLIVNTFSDASTFDQKDVHPEDDTLRRAKSQNIMIMRALDLFNLYVLIKEKRVTIEDFITQVKNPECGWVQVTNQIKLIIAT